jgi:spermidine/putrescine transport system permease protein
VILGFNGVVNSALMGLGVIDEPLTFILYSVNSIVITLAHAYAPFAILPIFVALEKIDRSFLEAGRDLGETPFVTFVRVTLPLAMPGVISAVMIVFIPTIGDYVTPHLLGGPGGQMVANLVQLQYMKLDNYPVGSALAVSSMFMVGLALVMGAIGLRIFRLTMKRLLGSIPMPVAIVMALGVSMLLTVVVIACFVMTGNAIATVGFAIALHTLAWTTIWLKGAKP